MLRIVGEGEQDNDGTEIKLSKRARRQRALIESYAGLLDQVGTRILSGDVNLHRCRPMELKYFDRKEQNPEIVCFGTKNRWVIRGWHADLTLLDPYLIAAELNKKRRPAVHVFKDGAQTRIIVIFHSKAGFALVAERYSL
ncbi:MAG: hypothetical protein HY565_04165 [Candidatus Kerfeldbacteria bacterium]|nr:hypothetical protein [Candidatus Kerfeldbacteria bacterium]